MAEVSREGAREKRDLKMWKGVEMIGGSRFLRSRGNLME